MSGRQTDSSCLNSLEKRPRSKGCHGDQRARIFIAYYPEASDDRTLAFLLRRELEGAGHEVFAESEMPVGTDWATEIGRRIEWCDHFAVLISKDAIDSEMTHAEVRFAYRRWKLEGLPKLLPIRVRYDGPLSYELDACLGWLVYALWNGDEDSERVVKKILATIEREAFESTTGAAPFPSGHASLAVGASGNQYRPRPTADPRVLRIPGGTVRLGDPFYMARSADKIVSSIAEAIGETLVIKAPRQMGKSSLLIRYLAACESAGKSFSLIDFQKFSDTDLDTYGSLLKGLALLLLRSFEIESTSVPAFSSHLEFSNFVEDCILKGITSPVTIALDEVDRVLGRPYQNDLFSLLRHWHNSRQPFLPWDRVDLALVISTEPYLLIDRADQSPFNVTSPIELEPFSRPCLDELNGQYGGWLAPVELDQLHELLGGHPYLTRLAFFRLFAERATTFGDIVKHAADGDGPFGDHLRAMLIKLQRAKLVAAMRQIVEEGTAPNLDAYYRLQAAGLVKRADPVVPANRLYACFFATVLCKPHS